MKTDKEMAVTEPDVKQALRAVLDPELGVNVVDLGLVESIRVEDGTVRVRLGMTSPACPVGPQMRAQAEGALSHLAGVSRVEVQLAREFHWSPERMSAAAREQLGPYTMPPAVVAEQTGSAPQRPALHRLPFLAAGMLSLLAALWGGLVRIGFSWKIPQPDWIVLHGPLMVSGFLGTVIGLERAVGLERRWGYAAPLVAALGALALLAGAPPATAPALMTAAALALCALFAAVLRFDASLPSWTLALGAACWLAGNVRWLAGVPTAEITAWWASFLVVTIAGERLELNRFLNPSRGAKRAFIGAILPVLAGALARGRYPEHALILQGGGFVALTAWLALNDVARRTVRQTGLTRFVAVCLLSGYAWLAVSGALFIAFKPLGPGPQYDAALHALFIGFVFSMIFGHAPIIFPSVLRREMDFSKTFYAPLLLLHLGLVLRITGDLGELCALRRAGALLNAAAVVLFLMNTARCMIRGVSPRAGERP